LEERQPGVAKSFLFGRGTIEFVDLSVDLLSKLRAFLIEISPERR